MITNNYLGFHPHLAVHPILIPLFTLETYIFK